MPEPSTIVSRTIHMIVIYLYKTVFVCFILRSVFMADCVGGQMRDRLSFPSVLRWDWNSKQRYAAVTVIGPKLVKWMSHFCCLGHSWGQDGHRPAGPRPDGSVSIQMNEKKEINLPQTVCDFFSFAIGKSDEFWWILVGEPIWLFSF